MVTLIHGDDLEKIEKSLLDLSRGIESLRIDGSKVKLKTLETELLDGSLFGEQKLFIVENIYKNKLKKDLFQFLTDQKDNLNVILVERKKLTKKDVSVIKFNMINEHLLPQFYFKFLDEFYPGNRINTEKYYTQLLNSLEAEQIFYSIIKRIRALIAIKMNLDSHSEISRFAPWQLGKMRSQARFWTEDELINFYKRLYEIERKMKSSELTVNLKKYLDILILTELN